MPPVPAGPVPGLNPGINPEISVIRGDCLEEMARLAAEARIARARAAIPVPAAA